MGEVVPIPESAESTRTEIARVLTERFSIGDVFTKRDVRALCAHGQLDEQWGRRFRDLRTLGFVIDTYREDPFLEPAEHRLVAIP